MSPGHILPPALARVSSEGFPPGGVPGRFPCMNCDCCAGGHGGGAIPVPVPNTEVKPSSADDTPDRGKVGRRRLFFFFPEVPSPCRRGFFFAPATRYSRLVVQGASPFVSSVPGCMFNDACVVHGLCLRETKANLLYTLTKIYDYLKINT